MKTITYLFLDAFVVFLMLAIFWFVTRKITSILSFSYKLLKQFFHRRSEKKNFRQSGSCATPNDCVSDASLGAIVETKVLTPLQELSDWSQYESPAYMRKGIIIH